MLVFLSRAKIRKWEEFTPVVIKTNLSGQYRPPNMRMLSCHARFRQSGNGEGNRPVTVLSGHNQLGIVQHKIHVRDVVRIEL